MIMNERDCYQKSDLLAQRLEFTRKSFEQEMLR